MTKTDILLRLVKEDKITLDELVILMATEKEYIYPPISIPYSQPVTPGYNTPVNCSYTDSGTTDGKYIINTLTGLTTSGITYNTSN